MGRIFDSIDWIVALLVLAISTVGLFVLLSIDTSFFVQQSIFLLIAVVAALTVAKVHKAVLLWSAPGLYTVSNIFLSLVYLFPKVRGSHRWIFIANQQFQPSEFIKPIVLLAFAYVITRFPPRKLRYILLHLGVLIVPFLLVFRQPDLGTSIVIFVMWLSAMIAGGFPIRYFVLALIAASLLFPFIWSVLAPYQQSRILTFMDPALDPKGAGYNALQAAIAVGSGQFFGRGLGLGTQSHLRFLPEYHTDFIFASLVEELGFVGGAVLLLFYLFLCVRLLMPYISTTKYDATTVIFALGLIGQILCQVFVNAGMNMGIIPITGITMPFVSYGGSSLLSFGITFGILWSLRRQDPGQ